MKLASLSFAGAMTIAILGCGLGLAVIVGSFLNRKK